MKNAKRLILSLLLTSVICTATAQKDTLQCFTVGFNFGTMFSSGEKIMSSGEKTDLVKNPFLNFGVDIMYKFRSNWVLGVEGNLYFGNDNLKHREERLPMLYADGVIIGGGGGDAGVEAFNRGLSFIGSVGKIIPVSRNNPNSGIFLSLGAGFTQSQIIYSVQAEEAPQLDGDYANLYDHQQRGPVLMENIGYWFMSNEKAYFNFILSFEMQQHFTHSTRDYVIDHYMGFSGKDDNRYFTPIYMLKLTWMFPLTGKKTQEYYYY